MQSFIIIIQLFLSVTYVKIFKLPIWSKNIHILTAKRLLRKHFKIFFFFRAHNNQTLNFWKSENPFFNYDYLKKLNKFKSIL